MATTNITVDHDWTAVVASGTTNATVSCADVAVMEFATTADDETEPAVTGHVLRTTGEAVTRAMLGSGVIWCRIVSGSPATVTVVVDTW
jgi:hypothetical protein